MADIVFPLQREPKPPWGYETEDNVLRSNAEAGYVISRPRYTRNRDLLSDVTWDLQGADMSGMQNFYKITTVSGSLPFVLSIATPNFTLSKKVQFVSPPKYRYNGIGTWEMTCNFREV